MPRPPIDVVEEILSAQDCVDLSLLEARLEEEFLVAEARAKLESQKLRLTGIGERLEAAKPDSDA